MLTSCTRWARWSGEALSADRDGVSVEKDDQRIRRFMIGKRCRGRGCGREALKPALDFIRTRPRGKAELCRITCEPENAAARKLYASFGFGETGETCGNEIVAVLEL